MFATLSEKQRLKTMKICTRMIPHPKYENSDKIETETYLTADYLNFL